MKETMSSNLHRINNRGFITSCLVGSIFLSGCQFSPNIHTNDHTKTWVDIEPPKSTLSIKPGPLGISYVNYIENFKNNPGFLTPETPRNTDIHHAAIKHTAINHTSTFETINTIETHKFTLADKQDIVGKIATIQTHENDNLPDIARHFGLGYNDITIVNPHLDPWLPGADSQVVLPLRFILPGVKREGLVLNLASMRLFHFSRQTPKSVTTYPIGIGRKGWSTPKGITKIIEKKKDPAWYVPSSIRREHARKGDPLPSIVAPGPDNPLGEYAMRLGFRHYLIHGTNRPYGVGMKISHGCVRLYPEDIKALFQQVATGTAVRIIDQPYLLGWDNDMLLLEAHEPLQWQQKAVKKKLVKKLKLIARQSQLLIDWEKVDSILEQANGVPIPILKNSLNFASIVSEASRVTHPQLFYKQPVVKPLTHQDWSITVKTFPDANSAQKIVAMLNHQGPAIPARKRHENGLFHVVAGPFQSKQEVQSVINEIQRTFQFNAIANPPQTEEETQYSNWL